MEELENQELEEGLKKMTSEVVEEDQTTKPEKKIRRRKRKLYKAILTQMEFYFSDSNLRKDKFLLNIIENNANGYAPIEIFSKFNKIRGLTENLSDIAAACSKSELLEVSEDMKFLKRKLPVLPKTSVDECTVYVEGFSVHTDHKWIQSVFENFGKINYISLPRFKSTNKPKGFAFVEFDTPREARKACKYFKAQLEAAHHSSEESKTVDDDNTEQSSKAKRKRGTSESEEDNRKRPRCDTEESEVGNESTKEFEMKDEAQHEDEARCEELRKCKKKRKRKKKITPEEKFQLPSLRVMAKDEWKRWKNKYLSMQKAAMSEMKKSLLIDSTSNEMSNENPIDMHLEEKQSKSDGIKFQPGALVLLNLPNPIWNIKTFKEKARQIGNVMYIDGIEGEKTFYIRCANLASSESFLKQAENELGANGYLLKGEEESKYWEKIHRDRENKINNKERKPKIRGTEKVVLKATEKHNKHIRFDS